MSLGSLGAQRQEYLAAKRRELQRLLSDDISMDVPSWPAQEERTLVGSPALSGAHGPSTAATESGGTMTRTGGRPGPQGRGHGHGHGHGHAHGNWRAEAPVAAAARPPSPLVSSSAVPARTDDGAKTTSTSPLTAEADALRRQRENATGTTRGHGRPSLGAAGSQSRSTAGAKTASTGQAAADTLAPRGGRTSSRSVVKSADSTPAQTTTQQSLLDDQEEMDVLRTPPRQTSHTADHHRTSAVAGQSGTAAVSLEPRASVSEAGGFVSPDESVTLALSQSADVSTPRPGIYPPAREDARVSDELAASMHRAADASISFVITPHKPELSTPPHDGADATPVSSSRSSPAVSPPAGTHGSTGLPSGAAPSPTKIMQDIHARLAADLDSDALHFRPAITADLTTPPRGSRAPSENPAHSPAQIRIPEPPDAPSAYESIKAKVLAMSVELDEKTRQIAILRSQLKRARQVVEETAAEAQKQAKAALDKQKAEHEAQATKHLAFIDKLLADKKELAHQVDALTEQLAKTTTAADAKIRDVVERARSELLLAKENWASQEKTRRAAWQQVQIKEIRERTIKGLEPDIQRMMEKNKEEIAKIEAACQEQLRVAAARFEAERAAITRAARDEAAHSNVDGVERERAAWRQREEKLRDEHDRELAALRSRYNKELDDERRRSADAARAEMARHMDELTRLQADWQGRLDDVVRRQASVREEAERRVVEATATEQRRLEEEQADWERKMAAKLQRDFEAREAELRAELARSKEEHTRSLVAQMSGDAQAHIRELQAEAAAELARIQKTHAAELARFHEQLSEAQAKALEAVAGRDAAIAAQGAEAAHLADVIGELQHDVRRQSEEVSRLQAALESARVGFDAARADWEQQRAAQAAAYEAAIGDLTQQVKNAATERKTAEARFANEAAAAKAAKASELAEVESRVKAALKKRDDMIAALRAQVAEESAKAATAHRLMVDTRRQMLGESVDLPADFDISSSGARERA